MRTRALSLLPPLVLALAAASAPAQETDPKLEEWEVPWEQSRPRDPYVAPDGKVWFVGQRSHYAAYLDPETGAFTRVDLPEGAGPHNLVVDRAGMVWYTGNRVGNLGRIDPTSHAIDVFPMPDDGARDPHTLILDAAGDMWFTVQGGNYVGKFWKGTGEVRLVRAPQAPGRGGRMGSSRPYGIVMDSRSHPWIALFNTNKIATVDPETFEMTTFDLPHEDARPRRIGITSDDVLWYTDYRRGYLGRLDPRTGETTEWEMPSGSQSRPYGMAVDADDRIWFVETGVQPNMFVGFDPETREFFSSVAVGSGGGTIRHMYFDPETNSVWFGADSNTIGRAALPPKRKRIS